MTGTFEIDRVSLSVVVPTHEVGPWVSDCIRSILRQDVVGMEVLVVDDHSTDSTKAIVSAFAATDTRIKLVSAEQFGGAHARNQGAALAQGRYLIFADGDDIIPNGAYSALIASLERSGSDMAIGNFLKFSTKETWEPGRAWRVFDQPSVGISLREAPSLIRGRACWNKMFRRTFWESTGIEFPEVTRSNDIVPMTRALVSARSLDIIPEIVYLYRARPGNQSMTARADKASALISYLSQEAECARLLLEYGDEELQSQYYSMFLKADGWVHLTRFLQTRSGNEDPAVMEHAALIVKALLRAAPEHTRHSLTTAQVRVFTLFADGRSDVLALLNSEGQIGAGEPEATIEAFEALIIATAAVVEALPDEPNLAADALRYRMVRPLLAIAHLLDEGTLASLMHAVAQYRATWLSGERLPFFHNEREAVAICERGSTPELLVLSGVIRHAGATSTAVQANGRRLTVEIELNGVAAGSRAALRMKHRRSGAEFTSDSVELQPNSAISTLGFIVDRSQLSGKGIWDAHLLITVDFVQAEVRVLSDRRLPQIPAGKSPQFIVLPIRRVGHALVTDLRHPAAIRALYLPFKMLKKSRRDRRSRQRRLDPKISAS
ncbi:glycosyltransferase [Glaciibacter psychrotolerans]|uniref:Glycosyltransferase involved in cell wall biosynthesis n=1 Tax=Glaciibacter psychrotolerans TaxID=670054 RepID=A0A7Z0EG58_9MICO|nr:glycosyltransferase involved in cell wall biosynthesis [Leifsonia psychrotolerans]